MHYVRQRLQAGRLSEEPGNRMKSQEAGYFRDTQLYHDAFHGFSHMCPKCLCAKRLWPNERTSATNSSSCEQINAFLQKINKVPIEADVTNAFRFLFLCGTRRTEQNTWKSREMLSMVQSELIYIHQPTQTPHTHVTHAHIHTHNWDFDHSWKTNCWSIAKGEHFGPSEEGAPRKLRKTFQMVTTGYKGLACRRNRSK